MQPNVLIHHTPGTNRDEEAAWAMEAAGGRPEIVHINRLRTGERRLLDYGMLILPGGFSYGDALAAGRRWALDLQVYFWEDVVRFIEAGRLVLGICNGFQALVQAGLLPGWTDDPRPVTLTHNASGHFECRWVTLVPEPGTRCVFLEGLTEPLRFPVAHGEGRFLVRSSDVLDRLKAGGHIALRYAQPDGTPAKGAYPANPNGSVADIAGICNAEGNVFGLMPHPEDAIWPYHLPNREWDRQEPWGLQIFRNAVRRL